MKSFYQFLEDCLVVEGKVEWDNPRRPLASGWTPREKNRAKRISTEVENPNHSPSEKDYERYGKLKLAHDDQKNVKVKKETVHKFRPQFMTLSVHDPIERELSARFDRDTTKRRGIYVKRGPSGLKEPKESYDHSIEEGKIPWDDHNRPLRSGWTPREKNRAKRISTGVEDPNHSPSKKDYERYGKLKLAHNDQKNVRVRKKDLHKNKEDYALGRRNVLFKEPPRMPSENIKGGPDGLRKIPRNHIITPFGVPTKSIYDRKYGAKNDEKRDKYYKKGPKGLKEPKK